MKLAEFLESHGLSQEAKPEESVETDEVAAETEAVEEVDESDTVQHKAAKDFLVGLGLKL